MYVLMLCLVSSLAVGDKKAGAGAPSDFKPEFVS